MIKRVSEEPVSEEPVSEKPVELVETALKTLLLALLSGVGLSIGFFIVRSKMGMKY